MRPLVLIVILLACTDCRKAYSFDWEDANIADVPASDGPAPDVRTDACIVTATMTDPLNCGVCGHVCPQPSGANTTAACTTGQCGSTCAAGYDQVGTSCSMAVPRPIAPMSTSNVTSQTPILEWSLPTGLNNARIELCRSRDCSGVTQMLDASGTTIMPTTALSAGVWYWRLRGKIGTAVGERASATWEFFVGARSAAVNTNWGTVLDVNGDGYADIGVGAHGANQNTGKVYLYLGSRSVLPDTATASSVLVGPDGVDGHFGQSLASAGDINGDGYGDIIVGAAGVAHGQGRAYVFLGGPSGSPQTAAPLSTPDTVTGQFGSAVAGAGDVNRDGYGDVLVSAIGSTHAYLFWGGPLGLTASSFALLGGSGHQFGASVSTAGDVNGDRFADVIVGVPDDPNTTSGTAQVFEGSNSMNFAGSTTLSAPLGYGFGTSVACAGDLNGDGYSDVVVASHFYNIQDQDPNPSPGSNPFLGGPTGVSTSSDSLAGSFSSYAGPTLATGCDINRDGLSDVATGGFDWLVRSADGAFFYQGSATQRSSVPFVSMNPTPNNGFGIAVSLGDINGDGYCDALVGGGDDVNPGVASLFLSGSTGLASTAVVSLVSQDPLGDQFGSSLAR